MLGFSKELQTAARAEEPDPFAPAIAPQHSSPALESIELRDVPEEHPVRRFAAIYRNYLEGALLPHEATLTGSAEAEPLLSWAKLIEPIQIDGGVDFKVVLQGERNAVRERRSYRDQWMSETMDPEFVQALYRDVIAAAVLRRPRFSKGSVPTRERAFLYVLRGVFPVFSENHARLRLFQLEAEPYVVA